MIDTYMTEKVDYLQDKVGLLEENVKSLKNNVDKILSILEKQNKNIDGLIGTSKSLNYIYTTDLFSYNFYSKVKLEDNGYINVSQYYIEQCAPTGAVVHIWEVNGEDFYEITCLPDDVYIIPFKNALTSIEVVNKIETVIKPKEKLTASIIERFYKEYGYDSWLAEVVMPHKYAVEMYDDGRHLKKLQERDPWEEDTEKSNNIYVKLANLIAWFDIDKIAKHIVLINKYGAKEEKIETMNIDGTDFTSVRKGLYDNVKECIESFIRWKKTNELDDSYNIFEQQIGRIHFMAMFNSVGDGPDERWISYKLYWANEENQEEEDD